VSFICGSLGIDDYCSLGFQFTIPSGYSGQAGPLLDRTAGHRGRLSNGEGPAQSGWMDEGGKYETLSISDNSSSDLLLIVAHHDHRDQAANHRRD
jgi:hypothetical protein